MSRNRVSFWSSFVALAINVSILFYAKYHIAEKHTIAPLSAAATSSPTSSEPLDTTNVEKKMQNKLLPFVENIRYDLNIQNPDKVLASPLSSFANISTLDWTTSNVSLPSIFAKRRPARIINSSVSSWNALRWDWWHLSSRFPLLSKVLSLSHNRDAPPVIITQHERDAGGMIDATSILSPAEVVDEVLMANFLYDSGDPLVHQFHTLNYRVFESIAMVSHDTVWRDWLIPSISASPPPMLSLIHPGTALQARSSEYHTVRIQLRGRCTYTLYPPRSSEALKVYPNTHLSYNQAQIDLYSTTEKLPKGYSGTLDKGEVLYIPPYWYVHVEAMNFGAFLDVSSISEEQVTLTELMYMHVKNLKISQEEEKIVVAQYMCYLESTMPLSRSTSRIVSTLRVMQFCSQWTVCGCSANCSNFNALLIDLSITLTSLKDAITSTADFIATKLRQPHVSTGVRNLFLADFADVLARWAMGSPDRAVLFLTQCLYMNRKIDVAVEVHGPPVIKLGDESKHSSA